MNNFLVENFQISLKILVTKFILFAYFLPYF